jgi:hypothetical protein
MEPFRQASSHAVVFGAAFARGRRKPAAPINATNRALARFLNAVERFAAVVIFIPPFYARSVRCQRPISPISPEQAAKRIGNQQSHGNHVTGGQRHA